MAQGHQKWTLNDFPKPKLLVKAVNTWVRSAFGNVFAFDIFSQPTLGKPLKEKMFSFGLCLSYLSFLLCKMFGKILGG